MGKDSAQMISSQGFEYGVKHFYNQKAGLLSQILEELLQLTHEEAIGLINLGSVYISNIRQINDVFIDPQKLFRVHTRPRRFSVNYNWLDRVIYQNADFLVLNKPGYIPSHPSVDNMIDNSLTQLEKSLGQKLYITHRLDSLTEGLIVYAKTQNFTKAFNQLLQSRQIEKKYSTICEANHPLPEKLIHYMKPSPRAPKEVSEIAQTDWPICELKIETQVIKSEVSQLRINLMTGRTHQIRAQLAAMAAPILGDHLYGSKIKWLTPGIALRACELEFTYGNQIFKFNLPEFSLDEFSAS